MKNQNKYVIGGGSVQVPCRFKPVPKYFFIENQNRKNGSVPLKSGTKTKTSGLVSVKTGFPRFRNRTAAALLGRTDKGEREEAADSGPQRELGPRSPQRERQ